MEKELNKDDQIKRLHYVLEREAPKLIDALKGVRVYTQSLIAIEETNRIIEELKLGERHLPEAIAPDLRKAEKELRRVEKMIFACLSKLKELGAF